MRMAAVLVLVLVSVAPATGCGEMLTKRGQRILLATSTAAIACDWGMTRWMPRTGAYEKGYAELNPIMGRNPSTAQIDVVFAGLLIANVASYYVLPRWAKGILYTSTTAIEGGNIALFNPSGVCGDFGALGHANERSSEVLPTSHTR